ncbi:MAG: DUF4160 domain-containing protein [Candidatus Obscuribacter sp.]|nr:DUF4160 domain-containing protein [Candidatus Obscuribacter sp.]MBK9279227.1 DUF4160 domain-containing protein [Candidatus Obscuribacter sp.]
MAQLDAFQMPGLVLEMYPEDHSPPHFHIIKDNWNIRIKFNLSIIKREIVWDSKYPESLKECPLTGSETKLLLVLMKKHCSALNKQWKALHPSRSIAR